MDLTILKNLRKSKKIKLIELAERINVTPGYLSMVENNKRTPRISTVEDICRELNCELLIKLNT